MYYNIPAHSPLSSAYLKSLPQSRLCALLWHMRSRYTIQASFHIKDPAFYSFLPQQVQALPVAARQIFPTPAPYHPDCCFQVQLCM